MKSKEMERIMSTKVFETIHKAALDAGRVVIAEPRSPMLDVSDWPRSPMLDVSDWPRSPMLDVSDWDVEVQVVKD